MLLIPFPWIWTAPGEVLGSVVQRTEIVPAQAPVEVESPRDLPCILAKEIDAVDHYFSFRIAHGNAAGLNVSR